MSITVILAVGVDPWLLAAQDAAWRSAGFVVVAAGTVRDAIVHFQASDFDLVLLGHAIPAESKDRLTSLIRASSSLTPVVSIADLHAGGDLVADKTLNSGSNRLLAGIVELLAERNKMLRASQHHESISISKMV
jgi:DNA-binding response OmpR family regulator